MCNSEWKSRQYWKHWRESKTSSMPRSNANSHLLLKSELWICIVFLEWCRGTELASHHRATKTVSPSSPVLCFSHYHCATPVLLMCYSLLWLILILWCMSFPWCLKSPFPKILIILISISIILASFCCWFLLKSPQTATPASIKHSFQKYYNHLNSKPYSTNIYKFSFPWRMCCSEFILGKPIRRRGSCVHCNKFM